MGQLTEYQQKIAEQLEGGCRLVSAVRLEQWWRRIPVTVLVQVDPEAGYEVVETVRRPTVEKLMAAGHEVMETIPQPLVEKLVAAGYEVVVG